jgi:hypothetical protein
MLIPPFDLISSGGIFYCKTKTFSEELTSQKVRTVVPTIDRIELR